jgi:diguanylate cyclase (GGDEF)-like protein/PAS domain S-box-containing protein
MAPMAVDDASFQFLAENSSEILCRVGPNFSLLYISPSVVRVLGWKPEEVIGRNPGEFIFPQDVPLLARSLRSSAEESFVTVRMRRKDGTLAWVEVRHRYSRSNVSGESSEIFIVIRDITERRALEERLSLLELTDVRTGLSTHRAFDLALEREWHRSLREGSSLSFLLLDFDHFRHYHDRHREGDECLSAAAAAVISAVRVTDFPALHGDEDIAIILPSTDGSGAAKVAEKIQAALQTLRGSREGVSAREGRILVRIGMATVSAKPGASSRMPEVLRLGAVQALERAKLGYAQARRRG